MHLKCTNTKQALKYPVHIVLFSPPNWNETIFNERSFEWCHFFMKKDCLLHLIPSGSESKRVTKTA